MTMNLVHRLCCSSNYWAKTVERKLLPWALRDVELGDNTLEIGPGYGANLTALVDKTANLTAVEIDQRLAERLVRKYGDQARVIHGDGTDIRFGDCEFSSVVCFTMLHHVPTPPLQDQLFAEAFRVLQPGGTFAGSDGVPSLSFRVMHIGDTYNPVSPDTLPERLRRAGFTDVRVGVAGGEQRWKAVKGYTGSTVADAAAKAGLTVEVVSPTAGSNTADVSTGTRPCYSDDSTAASCSTRFRPAGSAVGGVYWS